MKERLALAGLVSVFAGAAATTMTTAAAVPTRGLYAAPGVIVLTGGPLTKPVVLSDWYENQRLLMATDEHVPMPDSVARRGERIDVTMYWGTTWSRYAATPESLAMLSRIREAQRGAYYPPLRGRSAVWVFGPMGGMAASARRVASEGLAILAAHHIPANTSLALPSSTYPANDAVLTLPSGTVVRQRNLVVFVGSNSKTLTIVIETPTPANDSARVSREAGEVVKLHDAYARSEGIGTMVVQVCRTRNCLDLRAATERFSFVRGSDGSWQHDARR